jgi:hypothetical protein
MLKETNTIVALVRRDRHAIFISLLYKKLSQDRGKYDRRCQEYRVN